MENKTSALSLSVPFLSGVGAGIFSTLLCNPFDVAKVRLQVQGSLKESSPLIKPRYSSALGALKTIIVDEGVNGAFKGLGVALCTIPLFWGIYWQVYDHSKVKIAEAVPMLPLSIGHMVSAVGAGAVGNVVVNPFWVVKTRIQTQIFTHPSKAQEGFFEIFRGIYYKEGLLAYYKGLNASLLGLSHVAIQFPLYEMFKGWARIHRRGEEAFVDLLMSSIMAKIIASSMTYPHEVLRARMQYNADAAKSHLLAVFVKILREEGFFALYSGYSINLVRIVPATVSTFMAYEYLQRYLKSNFQAL